MWISDKVNIGDDGDYTIDTWNNKVYASVKVNVVGDFTEKTIDKPDGDGPTASGLAATILEKAYTNSSELVAIDVTDKNNIKKCESIEACEGKEIEYRYIGPTVNNYVYLKSDTESNEKWRIIGLFLNDEGTEWNIKVVRDEILPGDYLPLTYVIDDAVINGTSKKVTYTIKNSDYYAYRNKNDSGTQNNRWEESGLMHYLNTETDSGSNKGYLSYLSSDTKALLVEKTYYLGTVYLGTVQTNSGPYDTPKQAYEHERKVTGCATGKGTASSWDSMKNTDCNLWSGTAATWKGKVALMYPSDYGLSASEANWATPMYTSSGTSFNTSSVNATTWMYSTMADPKNKYSWFLSPSSYYYDSAAYWGTGGYVYYNSVYGGNGGVRPVLFLSSQAAIKSGSGTGTSDSPYVILS